MWKNRHKTSSGQPGTPAEDELLRTTKSCSSRWGPGGCAIASNCDAEADEKSTALPPLL